ncbi:hypothetical protein [Desulfovulcanus sp.]
MTKMINYFKKIMDENNKPTDADDYMPDFEKYLESGECPFCHFSETVHIIERQVSVGRIVSHICPNCERAWTYVRYNDDHEITILGEVPSPFRDIDE